MISSAGLIKFNCPSTKDLFGLFNRYTNTKYDVCALVTLSNVVLYQLFFESKLAKKYIVFEENFLSIKHLCDHYNNVEFVEINNKNIKNIFIEKADNMKIDLAIMNPPYDGNLHLQILDIVRQQCKEVINISPIRWLQDPLAEYKKSSDYNNFSDLRNSITTLDVVPSTEVHKIFNINWGDLGIYCFNSNKSTFNRNKLVTCPKFIIDFVVSLDDTLDKHNSKEHKGNFIRVPTVYNPSGGNPNNLLFTQDINKCLNVINDKDNIRYFNFKTKTEATNFFNSVHLKLYRYIKKILHETHNTPFNRMPWLGDYTKVWTDQDIYNKFKFSKKQISIIEEEIK